jgi:hypothetical protein
MPRAGLGQPLVDGEGFQSFEDLDSDTSPARRCSEAVQRCRSSCVGGCGGCVGGCGGCGGGCGCTAGADDDESGGAVHRFVKRCVKRIRAACLDFGTCRCGELASTTCVAALVGGIVLLVVLMHRAIVPERTHRCLAGVAKTYKVKPGDSCGSISRDQHVPMFDIVDQNKSRSCCEYEGIDKGDLIELCNVPSQATWQARGLPKEKIVMTYLGGIGYINSVEYPPPKELPKSVNVVALAFAEDADGKGRFEMDVQAGCVQPECTLRQGTGFDADCAAQIDPSVRERGHGETMKKADKNRRWLVSIVPRDGNQWPYTITPEEWGANAAASLKEIILRYRLDGVDVDFEDSGANPTVFTTGMCSLFRHLKADLGPKVIISAAFYGNPHGTVQTIPLYTALKAKCDEHIDLYNYQNYANWVDNVNTNVANVKTVGQQFGWEKFIWGVGVGGKTGRHFFRWWPSDPGVMGAEIMRQLLQDAQAKEMRGAFTWAAEFSKKTCEPKWCIEDRLHGLLREPLGAILPPSCACHDG